VDFPAPEGPTSATARPGQGEIHPVEDAHARARRVGEADAVEHDVSAYARQPDTAGAAHARAAIDQLEDALGRAARSGEARPQIREHPERHQEGLSSIRRGARTAAPAPAADAEPVKPTAPTKTDT
jgi:hypothetical protein